MRGYGMNRMLDLDIEPESYAGDVPCAVETQRQLGSRLRNHL